MHPLLMAWQETEIVEHAANCDPPWVYILVLFSVTTEIRENSQKFF
jgi:hypothetical protein